MPPLSPTPSRLCLPAGIAPFRTFYRRMFMENVPNYKFTGESSDMSLGAEISGSSKARS